MSKLNCNYTKVPDAFIDLMPTISVTRIMLFLLKWQNADKHYSSHKTIATKCKLSVTSVKRALNWLKKEKFITVISGKEDRRTNYYIINFEQIDGECVLEPEERNLRRANLEKKRVDKKYTFSLKDSENIEENYINEA
jgi:hypothetical protein